MTTQHEGHRKRLLERFEKHGLSALPEYEIIELLLTFVLPRRDTKPIAKELLRTHKTVNAVLAASPSQLRCIEGMGERAALFFSLVREVASHCLREKYAQQSVLTCRGDVEEFLRFQFGLKREEYVAALYLDTGNHCIATDIVARGTVNQCVVYPRDVIERALRYGAAGVILAHNHPGGNPSPSRADWNLTERLCAVGKLLDIPLLDHIIISHDAVISLRDYAKWPGK